MTGRAERAPGRLALAIAGIALLVGAVALYEGRRSVGPVPLDAITLTVPLALLACVPLTRQRGSALVSDTGVVGPALVFLGFALLSVVADGLSVETFLTFTRYLFYVLLTGAVALVARDASARRFTMWAVAVAGTATVAYGGWWYVNSLLEVRRAAAEAGGDVPSIALRVVSTFQNANFYSEFLILLIAVLGYLVVTEKRVARWVAAVLGVAAGVMLLLTYTRGSWFGLVLATALVVLAVAPRRAWIVLAAPVLIAALSPTVQDRIVALITLEGSAGFRLRLWRVAGAAILAAPLSGSGIGTFYDAFTEAVRRDPSLAVGFEFYGAHNSYFTLLAETGVFGGIAFTALVLALLRVAVRPLLDETLPMGVRLQVGALAVGLGAFALNALTSNSFQHPQAAVYFWLLAGVLIAVAADAPGTRIDAPAAGGSPTRSRGRLAGMIADSVSARAARRASDALAAWWSSSVTRAVLVRPPARDAAWLLSSRVMRFVLGGPSR